MYDITLALMTGVDIPIIPLQATMHQPTIIEISKIGDADFFTGIQLLCLKKENFIQDKALRAQTTNFQLFIHSMNEKQLADKRACVEQALFLLFPQMRQVVFLPGSIILNFEQTTVNIDENNFEEIQNVLQKVFCLDKNEIKDFKPKEGKATEIAEKLARARKRVAAQKADGEGNMIAKYISVLTIGVPSMTFKDCCELTFYQLQDLVERYSLYLNWDLDIRSRLAGAKGDKPVEDWMKNIH